MPTLPEEDRIASPRALDRATAILRAPAEPEERRRFELVVSEGPEKGQRFVLDPRRPSPALIGSSPACDLRLSDPRVSRRHAVVEVFASSLRLRDSDSANGVYANGVLVYDVRLQGGEAIRLGDTVLSVEWTSEEGARLPSLPPASSFGRLVGASVEMRRLYPLCEKLAASSVPVLLEGETGTGKEVLAESLHEKGPRADRPFVVFDCTAIPGNLLESALFGHERGAFTGATDAHAGVFEEADGGTLLIDEIADLDIALQAKLLRAIEKSEVRRLGGKNWKQFDVRILAATRRDLDHEVQEGRFRDDLFFRIAVTRIELPPLRKRGGDIAALTRHFWKAMGSVGSESEPPPLLLEKFNSYAWPGNVRELRNAVARKLALGDLAPVKGTKNASILPPPGGAAARIPAAEAKDYLDEILSLDLPLPRAREQVVEEFERRYVARVLDQHGGHVARAAEASGLARRYFQLLRARHARNS
jgi:DNA-binding NtrC family response regulator